MCLTISREEVHIVIQLNTTHKCNESTQTNTHTSTLKDLEDQILSEKAMSTVTTTIPLEFFKLMVQAIL